ncbi:hypothetical protein AB0I54_35490 [Streptomyces sp. NPDC050625]|uniref:hypothetical protein n=1 Tax=Streptomyces sp. NPDC050625 TaxID=3154629 RepID=UPI00341E8B13
MTYRFTARAAGAEIDPDGYFTEAGLAEREDGSGFILLFMAGEEVPDDQEVALARPAPRRRPSQGPLAGAEG